MTRAQRIGGINGMDDYGDLPAWLKRMRYEYPRGGPASWQGAQELAPRKRQIWRQTRDHVYDLAREQYPGVYGGNG